MTFLFFLLDKLSLNNLICGLLAFLSNTLSYLYTSIINPGIPFRNKSTNLIINKKVAKTFKVCKTCNIIMNSEMKINHCKTCDICVEGIYFFSNLILGFDHHCEWLTKCIGKSNITSFYCFIVSFWFIFGYYIYTLLQIK